MSEMFKNNYCAICGPTAKYKILYKQNFSKRDLNKDTFSARRLPDGVHYRILRCLRCGLVFSSPILVNTKLMKLYKESTVTYNKQTADLRKTYGMYLRLLGKYRVRKNRLLEIGCGNGFFLLEAKKQGYKNVYGVEPSKEAVLTSEKAIRKNIVNNYFKKGLYPSNYFDVICIFQTFDHLPEPNGFLKTCFDILQPDGVILAFNHNVDSLQSIILREKSPIIDIEHTYLYNLKTMKMIFEKNGFISLLVKSADNIYSLDYLVFLSPISHVVKKCLLRIFTAIGLTRIKMKIPIGNLVLIAKKTEC